MGASDPEVAPWARGGAAGMAGAGAGAGARGGAAAGVEARARDPPPAHRAHPRHPRPAAQPSARRMDGGSGGLGSGDNAPTTEALFVALGAGVTALSHPLLYVKLLIQVGHEPMPPTLGTNVLGRKVLYLPSFFTYAKYIVQVDGKIGLFRGLSPRLMSNALSTVTRGSMKKVFPPDEIEQVSNKDDMKTSLKKVVKETSYEMMMQCVSRMLAHPLHVISMRCMVQFVGREAKYSGVLSSIGKIFKEEGLLGFFVGLIPHLLGDVVFLWGCNLLAHFINAYLVDDSVSDTPGGLGNDQNPGSQPGPGHPELYQVRDGDCSEHADLPLPASWRPHGCEQLRAASWAPPLLPSVQILDSLLEVPECAGPALPRLQPAFPPGVIRIMLCPGVT
uniref:Mitochondrial carrier homolog 1 n=1 Tax=Homo sapiens TaxID=9606 RepID=A0A8Q3SHR5_HUMAN